MLQVSLAAVFCTLWSFCTSVLKAVGINTITVVKSTCYKSIHKSLDSVRTEKFSDPSNIEYLEESGFTCFVYLRDHLQLVVKPAPKIPHLGRGENCSMAHEEGVNVDLY